MFNFKIENTSKSDVFDTVSKWDLLVVGGGPAGLNGALYAKRKGLVVGLIANEIGGQLHNTAEVDNYLGFSNVTGDALADNFVKHVKKLSVPLLTEQRVKSIEYLNPDYKVTVSSGRVFITKSLLIATGGAPRKLGVPGENDYANKGVTYCATCDAPFFKDKHVVVAGGGNSAAEGVLDLAPFASKITVVHRSQWRADQIILSKLDDLKNLTVYLQTQIKEVKGADLMTGIEVYDKLTKESRFIQADGLLVDIGTIPNSELIKDLVKINEKDEIIVDANQMTSLPGLYAAGDVTAQSDKQIIISAAEGAKAALAIGRYLNQDYKKGEK